MSEVRLGFLIKFRVKIFIENCRLRNFNSVTTNWNEGSKLQISYFSQHNKYTVLNMHYPAQDLQRWVGSRTEVEVVDMVLRLRSKLSDADVLPVSQHTREQLQAHLNTLFMALPEDLRSVLHAS